MAFLSNPFEIRFPVTCKVTALYLGTRRGTDADLARVEIAIVNQRGKALISNGQAPVFVAGQMPGAIFVPGLALMGAGRRWHPLAIPVYANETWRVQLRNTYTDDTEILAEMVLEVDECDYPTGIHPDHCGVHI